MKMKFKLLFLVLFMTKLNINAQEVWQKVDLSRSGLRFTKTTVENAGFDLINDGNNNYSFNMLPSDKMSIGSVPLISDFITKHAYVHMDISVLTIAAQALVMNDYIDEKSNTANTDFEIIEVFPLRFAFGGTFAKYFGLYGGVQWMYSVTNAQPTSVLSQSFNGGYAGAPALIGGNQRGFGGHFLFGTHKFLFRYSYMYDFIARTQRTYKGKAQTHEFNLFIPFGKKKFGAFITYNKRSRTMFAVNDVKLPTDFNKLEGEGFAVPELSDVTSNLMIGVYIEGLFQNTRQYTQTVKVK